MSVPYSIDLHGMEDEELWGFFHDYFKGRSEMSLITSMEQMIDAQQNSIKGKAEKIGQCEKGITELKAELVIQKRDLAISQSALSYAKLEESV